MRLIYCLALGAALLAATPARAQLPNPIVVLETNYGTIKIELHANEAPNTVNNFLNYVDAKHYNGTVFHRVIPNFMIQGGGFTVDMKEKATGAPIKNEAANGLPNKRGTVAMARTSDPHSATAQFFINTKDNPFLDQANAKNGFGYCVFGKVIDGMDVVDKISAVKTGDQKAQGGNGMPVLQDVPVEPVVIQAAYRLKR